MKTHIFWFLGRSLNVSLLAFIHPHGVPRAQLGEGSPILYSRDYIPSVRQGTSGLCLYGMVTEHKGDFGFLYLCLKEHLPAKSDFISLNQCLYMTEMTTADPGPPS